VAVRDPASHLAFLRDVLKSQYHASLAMLRDVIEACPDDVWQSDAHRNRYWQVPHGASRASPRESMRRRRDLSRHPSGHSVRSAVTGFTRTARTAGTSAAPAVTAMTTTDSSANVNGSTGFTPNNIP